MQAVEIKIREEPIVTMHQNNFQQKRRNTNI
jgi:hypothetical protein